MAVTVGAILSLASPEKTKGAVARSPGRTVLLICGIVMYVALLEEIGTVDYLGDAVADLGAPLLSALLICFIGAAVSAFASTTGILGALIPLAVPFLETGAVGAVGMIIALSLSSSVVDSSPFSTSGALVVANAAEAPPRLRVQTAHAVGDQADLHRPADRLADLRPCPVGVMTEPLLARVLELGGDRPALRVGDRALTYAELRAAAAAVAATLEGVQRVAVWAEPTLETCVAVAAAVAAGIALVPVNPKLAHAELRHVLEDSRARRDRGRAGGRAADATGTAARWRSTWTAAAASWREPPEPEDPR